jgi:hypothetical protein
MKVCKYNDTCPNKTKECMENTMNIKAKTVVDGKFWIVEEDGVKIGTLQKKENNKFMLSGKDGSSFFGKKEELLKAFGKDFFDSKIKTTVSGTEIRDVHSYPTSCYPFNAMFDVRKKLPLFTKSANSKSLYCAGYYTIRFDKGWVKSFCPKLITIERYENKGPFRDELEMKQVLANVKSD